MCSKKKQAKQKAATAIRVIINAARKLTAAEGVLLENETSSKKTAVKDESNDS
jgi:ribosomal protein L31E